MIADRLSERAEQLRSAGEPFVLATVVRARRPTSVRPGDHAVIGVDGAIDGFVGGVCTESSVRLHSLRAIETGQPILLRLVPDGGDRFGPDDAVDDAVVEHNPCLSGGALEIFLEPQLPPMQLLVIGGSPIARALERIGRAAGYDCERADPDSAGAIERAAAVVVCTHGNAEEIVLARALDGGVPYVALVASPRRGAAVLAGLDVADELRGRLHTPAGLDLGARTPSEIAISILAQIVAEHHADPIVGDPGARTARPVDAPTAVATAIDPVCGMTVAVSPAAQQLSSGAGETVYFCGSGCRERYLNAQQTAGT